MNKFIIVYIDDIFVYSNSLEAHIEHLWLILKKLIQHQLYKNINKSEFGLKNISFLCHIMSFNEISLDMQNIQISN